MYFYFHALDLTDPNLQVPGVDAETIARIAALVTQLTTVVDDEGIVHRRGSSRYHDLDTRLKLAKGISEKHYHKRLFDNRNNPVELRRSIHWHMMRRAQLIGLLLHYHERSVQDHEALTSLIDEVTKLQPQLAGLTHSNPLVGLCVALSGLAATHPAPFDLRKELSDDSDVTLAQALESVNLVFDVMKTGLGTFETYHSLGFHPIRVRNPSPAQVELLAAIAEARQMHRSFSELKSSCNYSRGEINRTQFARNLEYASVPSDSLPEWQRGSGTIEQAIAWQQRGEATFLAYAHNIKLRRPALDAVRTRLTEALARACAEHALPRGDWELVRAFDTEDGLNRYKSVLNCIHARFVLHDLDEHETACQRIDSEPADSLLDFQTFVAESLVQARKPLPSTVAPKEAHR